MRREMGITGMLGFLFSLSSCCAYLSLAKRAYEDSPIHALGDTPYDNAFNPYYYP